MIAKVILNPYAGRWSAQKRRDEVTQALDNVNINYDLELTKGPGHGSHIASDAIKKKFSPIIVAGGDGSISEVVNGMMAATKDLNIEEPPSLGVMPLGSANDLVVNLGLPTILSDAAQVIASNHVRKMDLGIVNSRYFDNNSAIGLEPTVTLIQQKIKHLRGTIRYLTATIMAIIQNPQWTGSIEWDDGKYSGPITLVTVGISPITGGLFYMTPHADAFDGKLTFVYGSIHKRLQIINILPKTMKPGKGSYVENPAIHEIHATWLKIHTDRPTPMHADGEIQNTSIQDLEYYIKPKCLPIILNQ